MPPCTSSQLVGYKSATGEVVALAHQYLLADGRIGASGRPDPKYLVQDNTIYKIKV